MGAVERVRGRVIGHLPRGAAGASDLDRNAVGRSVVHRERLRGSGGDDRDLAGGASDSNLRANREVHPVGHGGEDTFASLHVEGRAVHRDGEVLRGQRHQDTLFAIERELGRVTRS